MSRALVAASAACAFAIALLSPRDASPHNPVTTTVLFGREVSTLLQRACLPCHVGGGLAMSLATFEEARPWAVAIKEEILERRMPPWSAERGYGAFANDLSLTTRERDFLVSWIDGGTPKGEGEPPAVLDHSAHWMLGTPDIELATNAGFVVEPRRPIQHTRLVLPTAQPRDSWLRALDYKPSDTRVVRAAFFSIVETGQYLGAWTPWRTTVQMPDGAGVRLPSGARIAVDVVYQSASERVVDAPRLGLYLTGARPARDVTTTVIEGAVSRAGTASSADAGSVPDARSGANAGQRRVTATRVLPRELTLFELRPQMGPGARSLEVKVTRPDGSSQVLLWIRAFREEWPTSYVLARPLTLPKGSIVSAVAYFDAMPKLAAPDASAPTTSPTAASATSSSTAQRFSLTFNSVEAAGPRGPAALTAGLGPRLPGSGR